MRRKIAAILAADIAGYSRLIAEDEEETVRRLSAYREVFDDFIKRSGGRIFNTAGDSVLAEFPSAVDALRCAIDVQETLRTRNLAYPPSRQMAFRMGMTIGDVVEREGDLLGDGVNIAARLQTLSKPGSICLSKAVYDAVANKVSVKYVDMGKQEVKNIPYPVHAYSITASERPNTKPANAEPGETTYETVERPQTMKLAVALVGALAAGAVVAFVATKFQTGTLPPAKPVKPVSAVEAKSTVGTSDSVASKPAEPLGNSSASSTSEVKTTTSSDDSVKAGMPDEVRTKPIELAPARKGSGEETKLQQKAPASKEVAAVDPAADRDVAATMRLRQNRWNECNGADVERALDSCGELTRDDGMSPTELSTANRALGLAYRKNGKLDDAIGSYTKSIELAASAQAYDGRGISFLLKSDTTKALKDFNQAIALDDQAGESYNNRAWTYYKLGKSKEALADADRAVALIPDKADAWDTRAHIHELLGEKKEALADFERANAIDGTLQSAAQGMKRLRSD